MKKYQQDTDLWIKKFGVRYFSELTNLAILMEEVGELSRLMSRKYGEQSFKTGEHKEDVENKIAEELSDILFVCFCLANQMGIDIEASFNRKMKIRTERDSQRHTNNPKLGQ